MDIISVGPACIERVRASNGSCPMCKEEEYQAIPDKKCLRIINGLEVYCSNKEKGCQWKGELKNMSTHLNKEKREGECQYEEVKCRYEKCQERKQRRYLKDHEDNECPQRPFQCQYCRRKGTFLSITKDHQVNRECPLEPVDCVFSWAGCNDKPLRKDVHVHTADTKHMTLLAVACGQLKKENEQMKEENEKIKVLEEEVGKLKIENEQIKEEIADLKSRPYHQYPLLPVDVTVVRSETVHFYTSACGRHMSARMIKGYTHGVADHFVLLAFHDGKFDKFKPKLPKIFAKFEDEDTPLIVDTEATYKQLPHDILDRIRWGYGDTTVPQGVIKIKTLYITITATICTQ